MSDKPWEAQPQTSQTLSPIIAPVDKIIIEIDNRTNPVRVNMLPSRQLPIPFVINIFSNLISQLSAQLAQALTQPLPLPGTTPPATPSTMVKNNGT